MSQKILLAVHDVEAMYGIPASTQAKARMKGGFCPFMKYGRSVYYRKCDVDEHIASLCRHSTSDNGTPTHIPEEVGS